MTKCPGGIVAGQVLAAELVAHIQAIGLDGRGFLQRANSAIVGDALRRLSDQSTHLYVDNQRYWYSTQTNVTRLALDRAAQYDDDALYEEIEKRRCRRSCPPDGDVRRDEAHVGAQQAQVTRAPGEDQGVVQEGC